MGSAIVDKLVPSHKLAILDATFSRLLGEWYILYPSAGWVLPLPVVLVVGSRGAIDCRCTIIQDHLDEGPTLLQVRCECIIATISWRQLKIIFVALLSTNSKEVAVIIRSSHQGLAIGCAVQAAVDVAHHQQCIFLVFVGPHAAQVVGCSNVIMARPTYADPIVAVAVGPKTVAFRAQTTHQVSAECGLRAIAEMNRDDANTCTQCKYITQAQKIEKTRNAQKSKILQNYALNSKPQKNAKNRNFAKTMP